MKRKTIRIVAILLGLALGWLAAGFLPQALNAETTSGHENQEAKVTAGHAGEAVRLHPEHKQDAGQTAAAQLVPQEYDIAWVKPVLALVVGLFAAAIVIGIPTKALVKPVTDESHPAGGHSGGH